MNKFAFIFFVTVCLLTVHAQAFALIELVYDLPESCQVCLASHGLLCEVCECQLRPASCPFDGCVDLNRDAQCDVQEPPMEQEEFVEEAPEVNAPENQENIFDDSIQVVMNNPISQFRFFQPGQFVFNIPVQDNIPVQEPIQPAPVVGQFVPPVPQEGADDIPQQAQQLPEEPLVIPDVPAPEPIQQPEIPVLEQDEVMHIDEPVFQPIQAIVLERPKEAALVAQACSQDKPIQIQSVFVDSSELLFDPVQGQLAQEPLLSITLKPCRNVDDVRVEVMIPDLEFSRSSRALDIRSRDLYNIIIPLTLNSDTLLYQEKTENYSSEYLIKIVVSDSLSRETEYRYLTLPVSSNRIGKSVTTQEY